MVYILFIIFIIITSIVFVLTVNEKIHSTTPLMRLFIGGLGIFCLLVVAISIFHSTIPYGPVISKETFSFDNWRITNEKIEILTTDEKNVLSFALKDKIRVEIDEEFSTPEVEIITYSNTVWSILLFGPKTKSETIIRFNDKAEYGSFNSAFYKNGIEGK